jgi:beta-barrel assembly-enhancing protease
MIAVVIAVISLISYYSKTQTNEFTGAAQQVALTADQEIAIGLQSAPQMIEQYGGETADERDRMIVEQVGRRLVERTKAGKSPYKFQFHVLADTKTVNAFALPGGQVFITEALLGRLKTEGALAGVLGHEIGHVVGRHGAAQLAKQGALQGLAGAATVAVTGPDGGAGAGQIVQMAAQMVNLKFGRSDEIQADKLGVSIIADAGYDPRAMISVMQTLDEIGKSGRQPDFLSTHPNPENRVPKIEQAIREKYPDGIPAGLQP